MGKFIEYSLDNHPHIGKYLTFLRFPEERRNVDQFGALRLYTNKQRLSIYSVGRPDMDFGRQVLYVPGSVTSYDSDPIHIHNSYVIDIITDAISCLNQERPLLPHESVHQYVTDLWSSVEFKVQNPINFTAPTSVPCVSHKALDTGFINSWCKHCEIPMVWDKEIYSWRVK